MTETKNPAIKLFGKRIKVPPSPEGVPPPLPAADSAEREVDEEDDEETEQDLSKEQATSNKQREDEPSLKAEEQTSPQVSTPSINEEASESKASKTGKDPKDPLKSQALKKPDKILPCPRCNSMETKFCYYNNYNINQPRHFCKSCQRYWTAGGTMRNVPVGAGRRKSKSSASRYQHISISEALQAVARVDSPNRYPNLTPDGTVLNFGLGQHGLVASTVEKRPTSDRLSGNFPNEHPISNHTRVVPQVPCLNSVPWPYSVPVPFYPPAFWACSNVGTPGAWSYPLVSAPSLILGQNSPILGKHPREGDVLKAEKNGSILIPKTLRIDDPTEAAKSSIWATLGIKNECGAKGGLFRGFQPKGKENEKAETEAEQCRVLCANPAALSRSLNFHEST